MGWAGVSWGSLGEKKANGVGWKYTITEAILIPGQYIHTYIHTYIFHFISFQKKKKNKERKKERKWGLAQID